MHPSLFLAPVLLSVAMAQGVSTTSEEKVGKPRYAAEARRHINRDPPEIFRAMLSINAAVRVTAMNTLFGSAPSESDPPEIPDASLRALQLDDDEDQEFIFTLHVRATSCVLVVDKGKDGWYVVGDLIYWKYHVPERAETILEVHHPFLLFRSITGGTGFTSTTVEIYRLWQGRLYKTAELPENGFAVAHGTDPVETITTDNRIVFRYADFSQWTAIEFRREETRSFEGEVGGKPARKPIVKRSCAGYEWVPATLSFDVTPRATRALCR